MNVLSRLETTAVTRLRDQTCESALQIHHAACELNFILLGRLLRNFDAGTSLTVARLLPGGGEEALAFDVFERSAHTASLRMRQLTPCWGTRGLRLLVCAYLDARMAEVTGCDGARRLRNRYPYPNARMFQRDEKWQLNRLLGEWLGACLADGYEKRDTAVVIRPAPGSA